MPNQKMILIGGVPTCVECKKSKKEKQILRLQKLQHTFLLSGQRMKCYFKSVLQSTVIFYNAYKAPLKSKLSYHVSAPISAFFSPKSGFIAVLHKKSVSERGQQV